MTCPCREAYEKAAECAEKMARTRSTLHNHACHDVAAAIRALPTCDKCETHVWVPRDKLDKLVSVHRGWCNYCLGNEKACMTAPIGGCSLRDLLTAREDK